ncbi:MAG TPA: macro domain-containing protein [Candidatus Hydrogenedens sp.]|nr:macro domain-containing protein [Candidatus Hydrogenedens sp.]HOK10090.1 macro domain-containing protein [Candidatus Hydrogenedens sp.]HOL19619.1 macro domain-containing protein [Candidatus Hydrogenedens sp.]HPP59341.1 macro domain-containing protein [Candidatus Hydrogenedens sp.]
MAIQPDLFSQTRPGIILFPTKIHWRGSSKIEWIEDGLIYLKEHYKEWGINSVAMPQIGCGLGGLPWEKVKKCIEKYFLNDPLIIELYINNPTNKYKGT